MADPAEIARWTGNQADSLREVAATRYAAQTGSTGVERDAAARRQWAAQQEAKAALQQVAREAAARDKALADVTDVEREAAALDAAGRTAEAEDRREFAIGLKAKAEASDTRWSAASDAAVAADQAARVQGEQVTALEARLAEIAGHARDAHDVAEALDARAELYQQAAPLDAEADRLEALAARLRADGDDIVLPDVERDAAAARAAASAAVAKADAVVVDRAVVIEVLGDTQGAAEPTTVAEQPAGEPDPVLGLAAETATDEASPPADHADMGETLTDTRDPDAPADDPGSGGDGLVVDATPDATEVLVDPPADDLASSESGPDDGADLADPDPDADAAPFDDAVG